MAEGKEEDKEGVGGSKKKAKRKKERKEETIEEMTSTTPPVDAEESWSVRASALVRVPRCGAAGP